MPRSYRYELRAGLARPIPLAGVTHAGGRNDRAAQECPGLCAGAHWFAHHTTINRLHFLTAFWSVERGSPARRIRIDTNLANAAAGQSCPASPCPRLFSSVVSIRRTRDAERQA